MWITSLDSHATSVCFLHDADHWKKNKRGGGGVMYGTMIITHSARNTFSLSIHNKRQHIIQINYDNKRFCIVFQGGQMYKATHHTAM